MVRTALVSYLVIIICENHKHQECFSQHNFAVNYRNLSWKPKIFLFLLGWCKRNYGPRTILKMAGWIFSNILLNNCLKRIIKLTRDKSLKKKKLQTLT